MGLRGKPDLYPDEGPERGEEVTCGHDDRDLSPSRDVKDTGTQSRRYKILRHVSRDRQRVDFAGLAPVDYSEILNVDRGFDRELPLFSESLGVGDVHVAWVLHAERALQIDD